MSQFPLEGGNPVTTRYRGRDVRQVSQPGITETLNAPGVVPLPPQINRNQMLAFELEKALGTLGDLGNSVTRYNAQEQYRKDRAAAALEKKQTEIDAAERGLATTTTNVDIQELDRKIKAGELVPLDGESDEEFAARLLQTDEAGGQFSAEYQQQRYAIGAPKIAAALSAFRQTGINAAKEQQAGLVVAGVNGAQSPDDIEQSVAAMQEIDPRINETATRAGFYSQRLKQAALYDSPEDFKSWLKHAGRVNGIDQQNIDEAKAIMSRRMTEEARATAQAFDNYVSAGILQSRDKNTNLDVLAQTVRANWDGKVSPEKVLEGIKKIDAEKASRVREATAEEKRSAKDAWQSNLVSQISAHLANAVNTGGASTVPEKFEDTITLSDGKTIDVSITGKEVVKLAVDEQMDQISKSVPKEQAFQDQVKYLSRNGVTFDQWSKIMQAGGSVQLEDMIAQEPGKPITVPFNAKAGYALYRSIGEINPRLRDRHLAPESDTAKFYELAAIVQDEGMADTPDSALALAAQAIRRDRDMGFDKSRIDDIEIEIADFDKLDPFWGFDKTPENIDEIKNRVIRAAKANMIVLPDSPDTAVKKALEKVEKSTDVVGTSKGNYYAINTTGRNVPVENLKVVSSEIVNQYVREHEGADEDNLALIPGMKDGTWIVFDTDMRRPVSDWTTKGTYTDADLAKMEIEVTAKNAANKAASIKQMRKNLRDTAVITDALPRIW